MKHKIFDTHPSLEKVFVTSDEEVFYQESDAKNHAKGLQKKTVETVYNPDHITVEDHEDLGEETGIDQDLKERLIAFDPEGTNAYNEGKALVKDLGIETQSNSKVDILAALAAAKESLDKEATNGAND